VNLLLTEIRHNPMLWLLAFVPVVFGAAALNPEAHTVLIAAIVTNGGGIGVLLLMVWCT
jgi:Ca2+:H+ antiporter